MNAASGLPGWTAGHGVRTQPHTRDTAAGPPFPAGIDYRLAGTRVKDASSAAGAAGLARSLTQPARSHEHGHLRSERGSHQASPSCPAKAVPQPKPQAEPPLDTGPLPQG